MLVTNLATQEQIEVTFSFLQKVTKSSMSMLAQYKYYELILEAEKHWNNLRKFILGKETETLKEIELEELAYIANIRSSVIQQEKEKTEAKQQHWNKIAAYNKAQKQLREEKIAEHNRQLIEQRRAKTRQWDEIVAEDETFKQYVNDDNNVLVQFRESYNKVLIAIQYANYCLKHDCRYNLEKNINQNITFQINPENKTENDEDNILIRSQQSYNRMLIALEYADYCITHDYRYNFPEGINRNTTLKVHLENLSKEKEIIALKKENKALRERITELEAEYIDSEIVFITEETECIAYEIAE